MASFLVKYVVDGKTKTVQGNRNSLSFGAIKSAIARGAGKGDFNLKYSSASGDVFVNDDASLMVALTDAEKNRKPHLRLVVV